MITRKILKRISIITSILIVIFIISIFPKNDSKSYIVTNTTKSSYIYLLDSNGYVSCIDIKYFSNNINGLIYEIHEYLTENTSKSMMLREGFYPIIPSNTKLLDYSIKDGVLTLNYSNDIFKIDESLEEKMIEAIIYSYTEIPNIKDIKIKIDGEILDHLPYSHKNLPEKLNRSFKINKEFNLKNLNNTKETTVYYLAKKDDFTYYIPVTKYNNDKKDKIDIVIEELKSSTTYNSNLINYLKTNVTLTDYNTLDNSIIINLSNIKKEELTEEITYAINASIRENYNYQAVIYYVDGSYFKSFF